MRRRWFTCLSFVGLVFTSFGTAPRLKADDASNASGKAAAGVDDAAPPAKEDPLSTSQEMHITGPVNDAPAVAAILRRESITPIQKQAALRGIADKIVVYEIP